MAADFTLQLRSSVLAAETPMPAPRSAHSCVLGPDSSLYLVAGDSGLAAQRFSDVWCLNSSSGSWRQPQPDHTATGHYKTLGCTARSNACAAAAEDWLLLFGGWSNSGLEPLAHLEAFSFSTQTWHTPTCTGTAPSPRGQPAAASNTAGTAVYVFGGWDGSRRFNDLHQLLLDSCSPQGWVWEQVVPQAAPAKGARAGITFAQQQALVQQRQQQQQQQGSRSKQQQQQEVQTPGQHSEQAGLQLPCERADHAMVCWHYCDDGVWKDLLVVFGGSCSQGLLNDTWLFDVDTSSWTQAYHGGAAPCPRSSCAAAITGDVLLVHGGQTPEGVLHDMHLLNLSTLTWLQVELGPILQPLCRHSMVVSGSSALIFGGYDGTAATNAVLQIDLQPVQQLQRSSLQDLINSMACCGDIIANTSKGAKSLKSDQLLQTADTAAAGDDSMQHGSDTASMEGTLKAVGVIPRATALPVPPVVKALSKKASCPPLKLSDLPNAAEVAAMPQWKQVRQVHQAALTAGCDQYIDPKTGYTVFTAKYLQQRQCCGNKCRHCPHGWVNVSKQRLQPAVAPAAAAAAQGSSALDW